MAYPVYLVLGSRDHHHRGPYLPGWPRMAPGPSPRLPATVFDIEVDTMVQRPIRNIDMSFEAHSRCYGARWLFPAIGTDEVENSGASDASPFSADEESTNDPYGRKFDEALEQIASEGCCVCPVCGAIVEGDGSVAS